MNSAVEAAALLIAGWASLSWICGGRRKPAEGACPKKSRGKAAGYMLRRIDAETGNLRFVCHWHPSYDSPVYDTLRGRAAHRLRRLAQRLDGGAAVTVHVYDPLDLMPEDELRATIDAAGLAWQGECRKLTHLAALDRLVGGDGE